MRGGFFVWVKMVFFGFNSIIYYKILGDILKVSKMEILFYYFFVLGGLNRTGLIIGLVQGFLDF